MQAFAQIERRDSGPAHLDKTSDEYYAPASEVTEDRGDWADSMFDVELSPKQAQQLRGWE